MAEGADFARRAAGGGLTREREGAVPRQTVLPEEEMQVVDLFVHPHAAGVLIHAHAPEAHEVALRVADEVGEIDELLLEGFDGFVGVALGELRDEVERVGFDPLLEFLFADAPVLAGGAARILLRDFFADLAALRNRLVGVELYDELTLHDVLFGRIGELVGVA